MTPSPLNHQRPDSHYSCWLAAGRASARVGLQGWPVVDPPIRAYNAQYSRPPPREQPRLEVKRSAKTITSNQIKPHSVANSP